MSVRRYVVPVLLATLLVVAGCTSPGGGETTASESPSPTSSETPTETPGDSQQSLGPWGIDANRTFERVEQLLDTEADQPLVTVVSSHNEQMRRTRHRGESPQLAIFGFNDSASGTQTVAGTAPYECCVYLLENLSTSRAESVLAHEYVHSIQQQSPDNWMPSYAGVEDRDGYIDRTVGPRSVESRLLYQSLSEGSAEYVEATYEHRYLSPSFEDNVDRLASQYVNQSGASQYSLAPYYYGLRYFDARVEDTSEVQTVFEHAPTTTEQLLHNEYPGEEPPMALSVSLSGGTSIDRSENYMRFGAGGELFTRMVLSQELPRERAIEAAAGWGNDSRIVRGLGQENFGMIWVTRWDTTSDADQFESAIDEYGEQRPESVTSGGQTIPSHFESERPSEDIVVVYVGSESVPRTVTIDATGANVTITPRD